jgi:sodium transport system permease protein
MTGTIGIVLLKELREALRDRRTLLTSLVLGPLLGPVFFVLVLKLALEQSVETLDEAVPVTVANAGAAPNLVQHLRQSGLAVTLRDGSDIEIRDWITATPELVVVRVSEAYAARFRNAEPAVVMVYADGSRARAERRARRVQEVIDGWSALIGALRLQARGVVPTVTHAVIVDSIDVSTPSARAALLLGMLSYLILVITLVGGLYLAIDATAGERERGSLEALLTVPVPRERLIYGKVLAAAVMMGLALALVTVTIMAALRWMPLESLGMSANFGPAVAASVFLVTLPFALVGAGLLTVVASFTRSYKEAQSWLGIVMLVPTLPIAIAGVLAVKASAPLMLVPSLSQHLVIQGLMRGESMPAAWLALSAGSTLLLGLGLTWLAGRLYRREAILGG